MSDIFGELIKLKEKNQPFALCTVVAGENSPGKPGFKMIVQPDSSIIGTVGGGKIEKIIIKKAIDLLKKGNSEFVECKLTEKDGIGMLCGGYIKVFVEPFTGYGKLHLFGAGHICRAMGPTAKKLGFKISVYDNREDFAKKELLPFADEVYCGNYTELIKNIKFTDSCFTAIFTHGHLHDYDVLKAILKKEDQPFYLGMIGSKSKVKVLLERLKKEGIPEKRIKNVRTPIGLFHADTPHEISISILGQMIKDKNELKEKK